MEAKKKLSCVVVLALLMAIAGTPPFTLLRRAVAQERTINVNEALNLDALGIKNEVQRIASLLGAQGKFFKRASELRTRSIVSPRDAIDIKNEGDQRKADLATLQQQFQSLINKLKQGNHWDETFDAQVLNSLKNTNARTALTQFGGARKLFQALVDEGTALREDIDDEVRRVTSKQQGALRHRSDRIFAAHAKPPLGKIGCNLLLGSYVTAHIVGADALACIYADRYNAKGCTPRIGGCD